MAALGTVEREGRPVILWCQRKISTEGFGYSKVSQRMRFLKEKYVSRLKTAFLVRDLAFPRNACCEPTAGSDFRRLRKNIFRH